MAKYQGSYSTPHTNGSVTMEVEAQTTSHAEELIKAQTGATEVFNIGYTQEYRDRNLFRINNSSSSSNIQLPSLKSLLVGGIVLYGLSLFGGNVTQLKEMVPNTQQMEYQQPTNNVIQYSGHHIDESIPEFFNTELQEEAITDLGQDWDN
jgi:hypothetical protein